MKRSRFSIYCVACLSSLSLLSCGGGGGGGDKNEDPFDQPSTFLPEGVTEITINFEGGDSDVPGNIKLTEERGTPPTWRANVTGSASFNLKTDAGTSTSYTLAGKVEVERLGGNAGFLLKWESDNTSVTSSSNKAEWEGTMTIRFYALDDENKCRYASVVDDRLQIHYYHNGSDTLNDYTGIRGCTMNLQFTVPSEK